MSPAKVSYRHPRPSSRWICCLVGLSLAWTQGDASRHIDGDAPTNSLRLGDEAEESSAPADLYRDQILKPLKSDRAHIMESFDRYFSSSRYNASDKRATRAALMEKLKLWGWKTEEQPFGAMLYMPAGVNLVAVKYGIRFKGAAAANRTLADKILIVGAHYDTVNLGKGVVDNGSGSAALLELARVLADAKCVPIHTIMLVWFDQEEIGLMGSSRFIDAYLRPRIMPPTQVIGFINMDMVLISDTAPNSQQPMEEASKEFNNELKRENWTADFVTVVARSKRPDAVIAAAFRQSWVDLGNQARAAKVMYLDGKNPVPYSDHSSFWDHLPQVASICLSDYATTRKSYIECYHQKCDQPSYLTDTNLAFMQRIVDALILTVLRLTGAACPAFRDHPSRLN